MSTIFLYLNKRKPLEKYGKCFLFLKFLQMLTNFTKMLTNFCNFLLSYPTLQDLKRKVKMEKL